MPRTIRFHLDENCHRGLAEGLRRRGIDVTTTPEAGLLSATDEEQAAYCLKAGRVIVTQDRDFLRLNAEGVPHAGIAYCDKDTKSIGEMIFGLVRMWEGLEPEAMPGRVQFL
jgi:predicted nuclease of predicted toxin-antitoxin system